METTGFDYDRLVQEALRGVALHALRHAAAEGLPGEHYFLIDFRTDGPDVVIPDWLRSQYPESMRIVLQHQYRELHVTDEGFSVEVRFAGRAAHLFVPLDAMTAFLDPSVPFGLRFAFAPEDEEAAEDSVEPEDEAGPPAEASDRPSGQVVSMDAFRKRD